MNYIEKANRNDSTESINKETLAASHSTLYIGFNGYQVVIYSIVTEAIAWIKAIFQEMLDSEPVRIVGRMEVLKKDEKYQLLKNSQEILSGESLGNILPSLKLEVIQEFIQACPDLLWFHAGAAAYRGSAVLLPGISGRGKSTLVTNLYKRGWTYLSDDIIPLDLNLGKIIPFPTTPKIREGPRQQIPRYRLLELNSTFMVLNRKSVCRESIPIGAIIFPIYNFHAPNELLACSPATATLELLQSCLNFTNDKHNAFHYVCEMLKGLPTFRLSFNEGNLASELIIQTYTKECSP